MFYKNRIIIVLAQDIIKISMWTLYHEDNHRNASVAHGVNDQHGIVLLSLLEWGNLTFAEMDVYE